MQTTELEVNRKQRVFGVPLDPDNASKPFRPVVEWLNRRTASEKLTAIALWMLVDGDTQSGIEGMGYYDGQIGQDLLDSWLPLTEAAITDASMPAEDRAVAGLLLGINKATEL